MLISSYGQIKLSLVVSSKDAHTAPIFFVLKLFTPGKDLHNFKKYFQNYFKIKIYKLSSQQLNLRYFQNLGNETNHFFSVLKISLFKCIHFNQNINLI